MTHQAVDRNAPQRLVPLIEGRKGGGKGSRTPVEDRDSLRSTQIADVVDLLGEGECEGLADGLKSVFFDGVPLQNDDGSYNFSNFQFTYNYGTQGQAAFSGLPGVSSEIPVGVEVKQSTPVVRTITNGSLDHVRVTLVIPQLSSQDVKTGDLHGATVQFAIDVQANGGGYVEKYNRTVSGKTMSAYTLSVVVPLTGSAPWDVRVRRITPDSTSSVLVDKTTWYTYAEIQTVKLRYPNTAIAWTRIDAQQFSRIPVRSFDWKGRRIKVPSNYNPATGIYTGIWDGTFQIAWSANPAWVLYDLITHERYGLGKFVDPALQNKWTLYKIGQRCDELVSDGRGGQERRFECHVAITVREQAYKVLGDFAAIFMGMMFYAGGSIDYSQDAPSDAELLYTNANVVDGKFSYQDTSASTLHSVFICYWTDRSQQGKRVPEVYAPDDLIKRYGVRELQLNPIGVATQGQAARVCRWARFSEQHEGETVSFRVGSDGIAVAPGKQFKVADASVAGERMGGRLKASTTNQVVLDAPIDLIAGETYTISVLQPDANAQTGFTVEERAIITASGAGITTVNVSPSFSAAPTAQSVFVISSTSLVPTTWRCLSVKPVAGKNQFDVVGLRHHPGKYDEIENGLVLDEAPITRYKTTPDKPTALSAVETIYVSGTAIKSRVTVSWVPSGSGLRYRLAYRTNNGAWVNLPDITDQTADITGLDEGPLELVLRAVNEIGNQSAPVTLSKTLLGKTAPPELPDEFDLQIQSDGTRQFAVKWKTTAKPVDLKGYVYRFRQGTGWTWDDMQPMSTDDGTGQGGDAIPGFVAISPWENNQLLAGVYTFAVKTIDTSLNLSTDALYDVAELPDPRMGDSIAYHAYHAEGWPGTLTDCVIDTDRGDPILRARDQATWATLPSTWAAWTRWVWWPVSTWTYEPPQEDFGTVVGFVPTVSGTIEGGTYEAFESHSNDGTTWSAFAAIAGSITARYIKLRITVSVPAGSPIGAGLTPLTIARKLIVAYKGKVTTEAFSNLVPSSLASAQHPAAGKIRLPKTKNFVHYSRMGLTLQSTGGRWTFDRVPDAADLADGPLYYVYNASGTLADPPSFDGWIEGVIA